MLAGIRPRAAIPSLFVGGRADVSAYFDRILSFFGGLGTGVFALVPTVLVIIVLTIVHRALNRQAQRTSGLRFRNQLIMAGVSFVGVLVVIVVLPVDAGVRGQLLTLVGIIISVTISLSSSTFLGNAMAGIMLKSTRNFRSGDFLQVGDHVGRVTERGLFHTEIQTPTRDLTTLPNLFLATSPVTVMRASGTIVDATVSLGYDVPHGRIEDLLVKAAEACELKDAFVQITDLGDYSVTYRVAGLLEDTKRLLTFRSRLRRAVLDSLHGDGIEIVSPAFLNLRDYAEGRRFLARPARNGVSPEGADADVDVVFDKAEEAESLENLQAHLEEAQHKAVELAEAVKAADKDAKPPREKQLELNERRIERLKRRIADAAEPKP
jgi:small conductance mechanosensitive channel